MAIVETNRLILRELIETDIEAVHEYASDPVNSKYVPWGPNTLEETEDFVRLYIKYQNQRDRVDFELAVIEKCSGKLIGICGLHISDKENNGGWIGYCINKPYWGKGYGTEIAENLLKLGFRKFELHRIYATCHPSNVASERILQKIGMKKEGYMRKDVRFKGGWRDSLLYAILEDEYYH
ncbi:GNAT family N-acetyltransferase [Wukongibacter sp. M2B1]|uniref:GNAT family N-acetyltransferase n=1 Tax=Wukongibacter sp. M2B1 TaxID=3088895 RepID=UPI003D7C11AB